MPDDLSSKHDNAGGDRPAGAADAATGTLETTARAPGDERRRGRVFQDLTTGNIPKKLFLQAWPQAVDNMLLIVDQMVDLVWAARLPQGFRAVAGIGVAQTVVQIGQTARSGLDQSLRAMVSRAVGARNIPLANHIVLQAFTVSVVYSVLLIILGEIFAEFLMRIVGGGGVGIQSQAVNYMRVWLITVSLLGMRQVGTSALQASSDVMTPLRAVLVTRVVHIAMSPFLMFGWWWFPSMGVSGAAMANALGWMAGNVIIYYALFKGNARLRITFRGYRFDRKLMWQMIKIGAPASVVGSERAISQLVLLHVAAAFGEVALAAYSIVRRTENLLNFGSMGVAQASGVMVGQSLGAGIPQRARKAVLWGLLYVNLIPAIVRLFLIFAPTIFSMF